MAQEIVNIPRESTVAQIVLTQRISLEAAEDLAYKEKVANAASKSEVDGLFAEWWRLYYRPELNTKSQMLERWFGNVLDDNRVHGTSVPLYAISTSYLGEPTDDSVGLTATPSTETVAGQDDFARLPQFWCLEVSADKNADGSHEIFYIEHIDSLDKVRSGEHLTWVLQKNTWLREWDEDGYRLLKTRCHPAAGYTQWPQGKDKTGKVYAYMANPKYPAGLQDGLITCGTGLAPMIRTSMTTGIAKWRERGAQYAGASGNLGKFLMNMFRLKYFRKGNAGLISGCNNYSYQYTAAISETGVERVIITKAQAANLYVGSCVQVGTNESGNDRNTAATYSVLQNKLITAIEDIIVESDETEYSAVYIDNGGTTFDTTAGVTLLSTSPYWSGWNDNVLGTDGSRYNPASGKEPGLLQKIEFMPGACLILADELSQWSMDENGNYNYDIYVCHDQSLVSSSITSNYEHKAALKMVLPPDTTSGWKYIEDTAIDNDVLWPQGIGATGSGVGCRSAFSCHPAASGVRASWVFGALYNGGTAGLAYRYSDPGPSRAGWIGCLGAPGLAG